MPSRSSSTSDEDGDDLRIGGALRALAVVGPPITIATGLLFYFGWAVTAEQSRARWLDDGIFRMSTRDYVIRSLPALYVPLLVCAGALLLWLILHGRLLSLMGEPRARTAIGRAGRVLAWTAWIVVPVVGFAVAALAPEWGDLSISLSVAVGILLSEYGASLVDRVAAESGRAVVRPPWVGRLRTVLVGTLVTAALFWTVAEFAQVVGRGKAEAVVRTIDTFSGATVYARTDLHLEAAEATSWAGAQGDYLFRYTGLRLLMYSGDRYFLVPDGWRPGSGPLVVLADTDDVRVELTG